MNGFMPEAFENPEGLSFENEEIFGEGLGIRSRIRNYSVLPCA